MLEKNNFIYVEPGVYFNENGEQTYGVFNNQILGSVEVAPDLEDFCVTVDLQVEVPRRKFNANGISENEVIKFTFSSGEDKKGKITFFSGTKKTYKDGDKEIESVDFSTAPYECTTLKDLSDENERGKSKELFGINSIDIEYNNYAVPVVTINFTDIRGIGLFASEEMLRDNLGNIKNDEELSRSFFSCFFQFPYPKFSLMVKGFYGHPVTYELFCADFKASFDSSTGNFNAVAKFVGYSFSLLNDVTVNALIAAPLSEYKGKQYWEEQVRAKKFVFEDADGNPSDVAIPTFKEFLKKFKDIQAGTVIPSDECHLEMKELNEKITLLNSIINTYDSYYYSLVSSYNKEKETFREEYYEKIFASVRYKNISTNQDVNDGNNLIGGSWGGEQTEGFFDEQIKNFATKMHDLEIIVNNSESLSFYNSLKHSLEEYGSSKQIPEIEIYDSNSKINNDLLKEILNELGEVSKDKINSKIIYFNGYDFNEFLKQEKNILENDLRNLNIEIYNNGVDKIKEKMGFDINVKNLTHIILAHLETLLHCIYSCDDEVKVTERTISDFSLIDIPNSDKFKNTVHTFPEVNKKDVKTSKIENVWIGNYVNSNAAPEINLIHGLLNGVDDFSKTSETINFDTDFPALHTIVTYTDLFTSINPFYRINTANITDFVGKIALRMANVLGTNDLENSSALIKEMGIADAYNFYNLYPSPNDEFILSITKSMLTDYSYFEKIATKNTNVNITKYDWEVEDNLEGGILSVDDDNMLYPTHSLIKDNQNLNDYYKAITFSGLDWRTYSKALTDIDSFKEYMLYDEMTNNGFTNVVKIESGDLEPYKKFIDAYPKELSNLQKRFEIDNQYEMSYNKAFSLVKKVNVPLETKLRSCFNSKKWHLNDFNDDNYYDEKGKVYRFNFANKDFCLNNFNDVTIINIPGYDLQGNVHHNKCLFLQNVYYESSENIYLQSFLFLHLFNSINFVDFQKIKNMTYLPYITILKTGAYLYCNSINNEINNELLKKIFNKVGEKIKIPEEYIFKESLINEFKNWTNDFYVKLNSKLSLSNLSFINEIRNVTKILYDEDMDYDVNINWNKYFYDSTTYHKIRINNLQSPIDYGLEFVPMPNNPNKHEYEFTLVLNQESDAAKLINSLLFQKSLLFVNADLVTKFKDKNQYFLQFSKNNAKTYYIAFIEKLKEMYGDLIKKRMQQDLDGGLVCNMDENIKIAMYKYLKILWDRWLCGDDNNGSKWSLEHFKNNFHFIDSFYCDASHSAINLMEFVKDLTVGWKQTSHSILTFLSTVYQKNRFSMFNVQNFANFAKTSESNANEKMKQMFMPLPYNKITSDMVKTTSDIVVLYGNEYSSKLNIPNADYEDDGFCFTDETSSVINIKNDANYTIPSFGVSYGKQYQHYFKDISVSMDSPVASEQALRARFEIANMHTSTNGENGNHVVPIGADLFTVYSNNSYSCTVKMMGCAWIQPLMYFQLNNIPMFRGAYLVHKVTHHIEPGNMETTIMGMRMSKYSTKIMDTPFIYKENDDVGGLSSEELLDRENLNASIYNNCDYKFYNPLSSFSSDGIPLEELYMSLYDYENKVGNSFSSDLELKDKENMLVKDLLVKAAFSEASTQDDLGAQLVLTVIFNRFCNKGRDLTKVFFNKYQHSLAQDVPNDKRKKYEKMVEDIFIKTPAILVNKRTIVNKSVPLYNNGILQGKTESIYLTLDILRQINMYCTTAGYDVNDDTDVVKEKNPSLWRNQKYCCHHEGHVFVSEGINGMYSNWGGTELKSATNEAKTKELIKCIEKTLKYNSFTNHINIDTKITNAEAGIVKITDKNYPNKPSSGLAVVFDVIMNTYSDYVISLHWNAQNSSNEYPENLVVFYNTYNDKNFTFDLIVNGNQAFFRNIDKDSCNELFYYAIRKKYNDNELKYIRYDCPSFSSMREDEFLSSIKNIFNGITITECKEGLTKGFNKDGKSTTDDGRPWDVVNDERDKLEPMKSSGELNVKKMTDYAIKRVGDSTLGKCAEYVRIAMTDKTNGGGLTITNNPVSACRYKNHLPVWGFKEIDTSNGYEPQNGDISVTGAWGNHKYGHIQIYCANYNGGKWLSDFAANSRNGYHPTDDLPNKIFRWPNNNSQA